MIKKVRGYSLVTLMSLLFFCIVDTKYTHALGDYILRFIGISPWTGDYSGTHMKVIYFGILFLISLLLVTKYTIGVLEIKGRRVFLMFIIHIVAFTFATSYIAQGIKKSSEGLLAVSFVDENSNLSYKYRNGELVDFEALFTLKNHCDKTLAFEISFDNYWIRKDDLDVIKVNEWDGTPAKFSLLPGEVRAFYLELEDYTILGGREFVNGSSGGSIREIILTNEDGESVKITYNDFFGVVLVKR